MPDNIIADIRRAMPIHAAERDVLAAAKALDTAAHLAREGVADCGPRYR